MRKLYSLKILSVLILLIFSFKATLACQGSIPPVCEAFGQAKNVFAGKLIKIDEQDSKDTFDKKLHFEVLKNYKGRSKDVLIIDYYNSNCGITFVVGESYLVYKTKDYIAAYDRVIPLKVSSDDTKYINSLSEIKPQYIIFGHLQEYPDEKLKGTKIYVEEEKNKYEVNYDKHYNFEFKTRKPGKYNLKIVIPFDAEVSNGDYSTYYIPKVNASTEQTIAETEFEFKPNDCNYVEYSISKADRTPRRNISGRVMDEFGNPVSELRIDLYPKETPQKFEYWQSKVSGTNENGEYTFKDIKIGEYILGVNLGITPAFDTPYPETFYPGQKNLQESQVVRLTEREDLQLLPFVIPSKLKTVRMYGKFVWADGTPVKKLFVYLIDPKNFKRNFGFTTEGKVSLEKDNDGNFSFLGFEGYSYIIHAHAFKSPEMPVHSKHFLIKASEDLPILKLELSLPGDGKDEETILKELNNFK